MVSPLAILCAEPAAREVTISHWIWFLVLVGFLLFLDLAVFHRKVHRIRPREALGWTIFFVGLALAFNVWIFLWFGAEPGAMFLTGYLIEEALSVDNLFVFIVIFRYFQVRPEYQHRILFWGILGAIVFRFLFIFAGTELIDRFHWTIYIFGAFLVFTGLKLMVQKDVGVDPERNPVLRLFRHLVRTSTEFEGPRFLVQKDGRLFATPLLLVLVVVETTDIMFAVDSVPAIIAITEDRFIIFTSNVFAILGLRSLYFLLAGMMESFRFLKAGLSLILLFVGFKMLSSGVLEIPIAVSLGVVASILATSVLLSIVIPRHKHIPGEEERGAGHAPGEEA